MTESLFNRIGGQDAVNAAVDLFYEKALADDSINYFFESTDMKKQRAQQKAFLSVAFGGPNNYTGNDLRAAHAPLVAKGLNDEHFNAVAGHLQAVLEELGVGQELISEVMEIAGSARDDVLNR